MKLIDYLIVHTSSVAKKENIIYYKNYRLTVLTDRLFRLEYSENQGYTDKPTLRVLLRNHSKVNFTVEKNKDCLCIETASVKFIVKEKFEDCYIILDNKKVKLDNSENLKGTARTLDMCGGEFLCDVLRDGEIKKLSYKDKDFLDNGVLSHNGVAVLDDSDSFLINDNGLMVARKYKEMDKYIFAYGKDYKGAIKGLFSICGSSPMLPKFVFGNWWSRYYDYTDKQYKKLINTFNEKNVPLSVATIDMDWHHVDLVNEIGPMCKDLKGWTGWSWNKKLFPDPEGFIKWLHDKGLKVTLNLHPADGIRFYEDCYKDVCEYMGLDYKKCETVEFDFSNPDFINAYYEVVIKNLEKQGVDFWWIDWQQGIKKEGKQAIYDPLWALNHYSYLASQRNNKRPLILSRYSDWGSHRYPLGFSGDSIITWEMLDYTIMFTVKASNIGFFYWSHDIGGHMLGIKDDELYIRWLEFGIFASILRLHSTNQELMGKEPWNYSKGTEYIAEELLRKRVKFIPYIYSLSARACFEDEPFIEPMYYEYPSDERAYKVNSQYYFGDLLVAPVTKKTDNKTGLAEKKVWLPKGKWYELSSGVIYEGDKFIDVYRYIEETPVFMPYNSLFVAENNNRLCICIYGDNTEFKLYEDDGNTLDYKKGIYNITEIKVNKSENKIFVKIVNGNHTELIGYSRNYRVIFENLLYADVKINGENKGNLNDDECLKIDIVNVDNNKETIIEIANYVEISNKERINNRIEKMFKRLNGDNLRIAELYELVKDKRIDELENSKYIPEQFIKAIKEIL